VAAPFLTDEWFEQVAIIRRGLATQDVPEPMAGLGVNLTILDNPGGGTDFHVRGGAGGFELSPGHVEGASTVATLPYAVARAMFVEGDLQRATQAFFEGEIRIEGDVSSLMALQGVLEYPEDDQLAFQEQVRALTA